jgi:hypothetical protein
VGIFASQFWHKSHTKIGSLLTSVVLQINEVEGNVFFVTMAKNGKNLENFS